MANFEAHWPADKKGLRCEFAPAFGRWVCGAGRGLAKARAGPASNQEVPGAVQK